MRVSRRGRVGRASERAYCYLLVPPPSGVLVATKKSPYRLSPDGRLTRRALDTEALSNGLVLADTMLDELSKCLK